MLIQASQLREGDLIRDENGDRCDIGPVSQNPADGTTPASVSATAHYHEDGGPTVYRGWSPQQKVTLLACKGMRSERHRCDCDRHTWCR